MCSSLSHAQQLRYCWMIWYWNSLRTHCLRSSLSHSKHRFCCCWVQRHSLLVLSCLFLSYCRCLCRVQLHLLFWNVPKSIEAFSALTSLCSTLFPRTQQRHSLPAFLLLLLLWTVCTPSTLSIYCFPFQLQMLLLLPDWDHFSFSLRVSFF